MVKRYKLIIVESPAKAKTIEKYLGADFKVAASLGHILDLPKKELGIDVEKNFQQKLVTIPGKNDTIKRLKSLAENAEEVFLASDPDREGEAISCHLAKVLGLKEPKRVMFHSITKDAVIKAVKNPLKLDRNKYNSQQARRILDRLIGYKISPVLWNKLGSGLSAGRVQSVALKIICLREEEIKNFVPEKWIDINADIEKDKIKMKAKYIGEDISKPEKITDESRVKEILEKSKSEFSVISADKKDRSVSPTPPYTTSKLQQDASSKLKMKSKQTMQVAQKLYENGFITYMRTDSIRIDPAFAEKTLEYIKNLYGDKYVGKAQEKSKKGESVQDAHEAIRPTSLDNSPEKISSKLSADEFKLYNLIWNKFVSSLMSNCVLEVSEIIFKTDKFYYKASGNIVKFDGFRKLYSSDDKDEIIPLFSINEKIKPLKVYSTNKESSPPSRYSEGTLIKELEEKGVGRPSTYSAIISNITDKKYVEQSKDGRMSPTEVGDKLWRFLDKYFEIQMNIKFTSEVEKKLDLIASGESDYIEVLKEFYSKLEEEIKATKAVADVKKEYTGTKFKNKKSDVKCPVCSADMNIINIKNSKFLGCSKYPECKKTLPMPKDSKK